jgi:thymidylate synthase (FAD)
VQVVAQTQFTPPADVPWETDADGGQALAEFAGRACYQSWDKPNPATATNRGYLRHILEVGHLSVLEHGTVSMYLTGVSRSMTHELVRHRHFSYSQLSQRYVPERDAAVVVLPNATETRIVVTGNYRAWRHFVAMRASEHADVEIRELAVACLRELQRVAGNVFDDFRISALADGTHVAASPLVAEG